MHEELHHRILQILSEDQTISQRELANRLGVSLGKTNYLLQALIEKGWVKARNFKNNRNKLAYAYLLTPSGIEEKIRLTMQYLQQKVEEYHALRRQIDELRSDPELNAAADEEWLAEMQARLAGK